MEPDPAPPGNVTQPDARSGDEPRCPWCGSNDVERVGAFGSQLMSEQYICRTCRSPFERIRK